MDELKLTILEWVARLYWGVITFFDGGYLISYAAIPGALLFAVIALRHSGLKTAGDYVRAIVPAKLWKHPSAKLDIKLFFIIQPLTTFVIVAGLLWVFQSLSYLVLDGLENAFGPRLPASENENGFLAYFFYSLLLFLAKDFSFYYSHYLSHRWPVLWCFHKVHHSAEVLIPFSALRFHPLDLAWNIGWAFALTFPLSGLCQYLFYNGDDVMMLFGQNAFIALSYLTTHNLRHSHIWLDYPEWLKKVLISPAQHQIHHSVKRRHWDKNFGYLFSGWDRLFGTYYNPKEKEEFAVGVIEDGEIYSAHRKIWPMMWVPFKEAWIVATTPRNAAQELAGQHAEISAETLVHQGEPKE